MCTTNIPNVFCAFAQKVVKRLAPNLSSVSVSSPNFLKVFITGFLPTVSVNLLSMDLRGYTMSGERMFMNKYLVTVLRLT